MSKIMEAIIKDQLMSYLQSNLKASTLIVGDRIIKPVTEENILGASLDAELMMKQINSDCLFQLRGLHEVCCFASKAVSKWIVIALMATLITAFLDSHVFLRIMTLPGPPVPGLTDPGSSLPGPPKPCCSPFSSRTDTS